KRVLPTFGAPPARDPQHIAADRLTPPATAPSFSDAFPFPMLESHVQKIAQELKIQTRQVAATAVLLEEGGTVPFIARYRKERTGELDEVQITTIRDRLGQLGGSEKRRGKVSDSFH